MKKAIKRLLLILSLVLLLAASVSLSPVLATPYAYVWGQGDNGGSTYWLPVGTTGTTSEMTRSNSDYGAVKGYARTSGTAKLYATTSGGWQVTSYATINDTYTFTDASLPSASGTIPNLYISITYSGTLYAPAPSGNGSISTFDASVSGGAIGAGEVSLGFVDGQYRLRDYHYDPYWGYTIDTYSYPGTDTVPVSGAFIIPITASYGVPIGLTFNFKADAQKLGSSLNPYVDFFDTAGISFYTTAKDVDLRVTSLGGFANVPLPSAVLLLLLDD